MKIKLCLLLQSFHKLLTNATDYWITLNSVEPLIKTSILLKIELEEVMTFEDLIEDLNVRYGKGITC